jgi:type II secretory pathway pseudopilin PulG
VEVRAIVGGGAVKVCKKSSCARRATTLIEMVAVIALSSVVMGIIGIILNGAWRVESAMENQRVVLDSIARFAAQFRDDVHRALSAEVSRGSSASTLTLTLPDDGKIEYSSYSEAIERHVQQSDHTAQRESYTLHDGSSFDWQINPVGDRKQVTAIISYPLGVKSTEFSERRELHIDAIVGLLPAEVRLQKEKPR